MEDDPSDTHEDDDYDVSYMIPVPKKGTPNNSSLTPISIMVSLKLLRVLFDPGSTRTYSIVPKKAKAVSLANKKAIKTISCSTNTTNMISTHERYQIAQT